MNLDTLSEKWDLIVIGGGITGAGVLREAVRSGLKVLLLEQNDFAWGTSSRSSKLVHGGLRYLKEGRFHLTLASVRERQRLMNEAPGLIDPVGFLMPVYKNRSPGKKSLAVGLSFYSLMAGEKQHRFFPASEFALRVPYIRTEGLKGGFEFLDAQVDDARLVLRVIQEARQAGAQALNYTKAVAIERNQKGAVVGLVAQDTESRKERCFQTPAVINATGVFAEKLHASPQKGFHIRPLRGGHLVFPAWAFPLPKAVSFTHPEDGRPIFAIPWEDVVLIGTTDMDHPADLSCEPKITAGEVHYLAEGVKVFLPGFDLRLQNCISTFAGVRPVLSQGKLTPSAESREHFVWVNKGLVTVTGGKMTTFRHLAWDALEAVRPFLKYGRTGGKGQPVFSMPNCPAPLSAMLSGGALRRLYGRYGQKADEILRASNPQDLETIPGTRTLWAELPYAAVHENVRHLADLLLRRVRVGLLCKRGGEEFLERVQRLCEPALPWNKQDWEAEKERYRQIWRQCYSLPNN